MMSFLLSKDCCRIFFNNLIVKRSISNSVRDSCSVGNRTQRPAALSAYIGSLRYPLTGRELKIIELFVDMVKANRQIVGNEIGKHPKRRFLCINQIKKSLQFLLDKGFTRELIAELPAICFYPEENIKEGFRDIEKNDSELKKMGYVNGILENNSPGFSFYSSINDKRLHLCLYYMEVPFGFSGLGIYPFDASCC